MPAMPRKRRTICLNGNLDSLIFFTAPGASVLINLTRQPNGQSLLLCDTFRVPEACLTPAQLGAVFESFAKIARNWLVDVLAYPVFSQNHVPIRCKEATSGKNVTSDGREWHKNRTGQVHVAGGYVSNGGFIGYRVFRGAFFSQLQYIVHEINEIVQRHAKDAEKRHKPRGRDRT